MTRAPSSQSSNIDNNNNSDINFDFEENSPFQEGMMSKMFQRLDKSFFQEPKELGDIINKGNLIHKHLPKQTDIDKILKIIQRKVLKGTHLPVKIRDTGRICTQPIFERYIPIPVTEKIAIL